MLSKLTIIEGYNVQIFIRRNRPSDFLYTPKRKSKSRNSPTHSNPNKDYERVMYKMKQAAFENKKAYEINMHILKSNDLI